MQWFLERITAKSLPINFGIKEKREHPDDFAKLISKGVLTRTQNLDSIDCDLCDDSHECQVRNDNGTLFYVCENGCGKRILTDDDLALYEYDNNAFLKLVADEFGIKTNGGTFSDEAAYTDNSFYGIGAYESGKIKAEAYYLRTEDAHEPSSYFERISNATKILITNTAKPDMVSGKEGTLYCVLADTLAVSANKHIFDKAKFAKCLEGVRRVRFDKKNGHLFLDNKRIYTAPLNSQEFYFLLCLWENWQKQMPHADIHYFIREQTGKDTNDTAQKFCQKVKSEIKKKYKAIDTIITIPTTGHYMMADPL